MNEKNIKVIDDKGFTARLLKVAAGDQVLKSLADIILVCNGFPAASTLTTAIRGVLSYVVQDRSTTFFEEIAAHPEKIRDQEVQSEEFIHKFWISYNAVVKVHEKEKIKLLARMFSNASSQDVSVSQYEECFYIINDLSYREISYLALLDNLLINNAPGEWAQLVPMIHNGSIDGFQLEKIQLNQYANIKDELYSKLETAYGVPPTEIRSFLMRLARSGLYQIHDTIAKQTGDGTLTPLYYKIKSYVVKFSEE
jgi:hypothetical protein